jgi:replicative DNA helicase
MSQDLALVEPGPSDAALALHNLEGECELLGTLLRDNSVFDLVADVIAATDFAEPLHQRIYETALHEAMAGRTANPVTLKAHFADDPAIKDLGGTGYLIRLTGETYSLTPPLQLARHLRELSRRRAMRHALSEAATACLEPKTSLAAVAALADTAVRAADDAVAQVTSAAECLGEMIDALGTPVEGVKCHTIPPFDELVGVLEPAHLVVLAGRPGMGKTAVALSYARGAAQAGDGVLFVSHEMNRRQLAGRMAAEVCFDRERVPYHAIRDRRLNDADKRRVVDAWSRIQKLPLVIADKVEPSTGALASLVRSQARRFAARGTKLRLVIVDYLQLMRPSTPANSRYEIITEVSIALKKIATDNDVAVMALAQLSREVEKRADKRPDLADLKESGQIEQDADSVVFLHRPEYYLAKARPPEHDEKFPAWEQDMEAERGRIEFILAKQRHGAVGVAVGTFYGAYQAVRG